MKRLTGLTTTLLILLLAANASAGIVVVVNAANPVNSLSRRELVDLYMGRTQYFSDGKQVLRLDQAPDSGDRARFYRVLVNKSTAEINGYWARLLFTGRASPPQAVDDSKAVLDIVRSNKSAIGYVRAEDVDASVKVVAHVD